MNEKKQRRIAAQKKAKQMKTAMLIAAAFLVAAIVFAVAVHIAMRPETRVFGIEGGYSVTLHGNGSFDARLFHGRIMSGSFSEEVSGDITLVRFNRAGETAYSLIQDDVLSLPIPWRAGCAAHVHETDFPLVR